MSSFAALKQQRQARASARPYGAATAIASTDLSTLASDNAAPREKSPDSLTQRTTQLAISNDASSNLASEPTHGISRNPHNAPVAPHDPVQDGDRTKQKGLGAGPSDVATATSWRPAENPDLLVKHAQAKGRGIFWQPRPSDSAARCRAGDVLMRLRPTVSVLDGEHLSRRCSYCHQPGKVHAQMSLTAASFPPSALLQRCAACKVVKYCDAECQRRDWPQHKEECRALKVFAKLRAESLQTEQSPLEPADGAEGIQIPLSQDHNRRDPGSDVRLAARLLWTRRRVDSRLKGQIDQMVSHKTDMPPESLRGLAQLAHRVAYFLRAPQLDTARSREKTVHQQDVLAELGMGSAADLLDFVCKLMANRFTLNTADLVDIGSCIETTAALLNHSCRPNAAWVFPWLRGHGSPEGPEAGAEMMVLVAIRDIEPGEEVQVSYVDVADRFEDRQAKLKQRYSFECRCPLCARTLMQMGTVPGPTSKTKWSDPREAMWCLNKCGGWISRPLAVGQMAGVCNKCKRECRLDPDRIAADLVQGKQAVLETGMMLARGDHVSAWKRCSDLLPGLLERYPPSSQPLFNLLGAARSALVGLANAQLSLTPDEPAAPSGRTTSDRRQDLAGPAAYRVTFKEATRLSMLVAAGCQASSVAASNPHGPLYTKGHPARAMHIAMLAKLLSLHTPGSICSDSLDGKRAGGQIASAPPGSLAMPADSSSAIARQAIIQAVEEVEIGFGKSNSGGLAGSEMRTLLTELEAVALAERRVEAA